MEDIRLIEEYLEGSLEEDERKVFEERVLRNTKLRKLLDLHKDVNDSIRDNDFSEFTDLVRNESNTYTSGKHLHDVAENHSVTRLNRRFLLRIAAAIVFLITAGVLLRILVFSGHTPQQLYKKNYTVYGADMVLRAAGGENTDFEKALRAYINNNYSEALSDFTVITQQDPGNNIAMFYKGLTCLELNNTKEAIQALRDIPSSWDSPFIEHRNWYLALALLKNDNVSEAIDILNEIQQSKGYYAEKAEAILKKLRI